MQSSYAGLAPAVIVLLRDTSFAAGKLGRFPLAHRHLNLPQQRHDLLSTKPLLRQDKNSLPKRVLTFRLVQKEPVRSLSNA
jgi:hypothetical protein